MIRYAPSRRKRDPSIALINVVFLMLIFFLIAGTVTAPLESDLKLVKTAELEGRAPPDALVLREDGSLSFRGEPTDLQVFMATHSDGPVRVVPDQNASAARLVQVARILRGLGASSVVLVTERALE